MFDSGWESREDRLAREAKEVKKAKEIAEQQLGIGKLAFIFGDIRIDMLNGFRTAQSAFIYEEDENDNYFGLFDLVNEAIYDDMSASSFKVGDRFVCRVREAKKDLHKEIWLQYKFNKSYVNLYDPERYFFRKAVDSSMFIFVKPDGLSMILTSTNKMEISSARKLMIKTAKSIIKYDDNGYTLIKKSAV